MFNRVCIVGIGLIGGSFGLALKKHGLAREIVGVARSETTLREAVEVGACDFATADLIEAATGADLVFLAPPVGQMSAICSQIAPVIAPGALVTDAGSTKADIVRECAPFFGSRAHFIGGHPMAGSEKVGPLAARADLFDGATWILTPTPQTSADALLTLRGLVESFGAKPLVLDAQTHDELLAVTSHLPHLAAVALVHVFLTAKSKDEATPQLIAGGWRDGTRVAAGSPEMWRDICLANRGAVSGALSDLTDQLLAVKSLLETSDSDALLAWFQSAANERRNY